jgi:outer membrane lipoprotein-sorting protein
MLPYPSNQTPRLIALVASLLAALPALAIDADAFVAAADAIRFPTEPFQVEVKVTTTGKSGQGVHAYQVLQKGHDNSVVRTTAPASEKGQVMLLKGADLWVFMPQVSQPVRLPLSQRLTGQVANGDLARANFSGDYKATLIKEEVVAGKKCAQLELTAARKGVTYQRVLYWVEIATKRPVKVEFYTVSKRLMKSGVYQEFKDIGGGVIRPARLVLTDALRQGEQSVLQYSGLKKREIPDKVFTKEFLRKLQN